MIPAALAGRLALLVDRPDPEPEGELWDATRLEQHGRKLASASGAVSGRRLDLRRPIYRKTASYGHFGRDAKECSWEKLDLRALMRKTFEGR